MRELAERCGAHSYLIDGPADINSDWIINKKSIGITAGASAPEILVKDVIQGLTKLGAKLPKEMLGKEENISFSLPKELREK